MKATELAEALTIFASYDNNVKFAYQPNYFYIYGGDKSKLKQMTALSLRKLASLNWVNDGTDNWIRPEHPNDSSI